MKKPLLLLHTWLLLCIPFFVTGQSLTETNFFRDMTSSPYQLTDNLTVTVGPFAAATTIRLYMLDSNGDKVLTTLREKTVAQNGSLTIDKALITLLAENRLPPFRITYNLSTDEAKNGTLAFIAPQAGQIGNNSQTNTQINNPSCVGILTEARNYVFGKYDFNAHFSKKKNLYLQDGVVHVFMDENGNLIETGVPTAAQENYTYQLHVIINKKCTNKSDISFHSQGDYKPEFNYHSESSGSAPIAISGTGASIEIEELVSNVMGRFTGTFTVKVKKKNVDIFNQTITANKRYHFSIVTGLVASSLTNPENVQISDLKGDATTKTLIADDPDWRGMVTVMAVYYPSPRSFLFEPENFGDHFGWVVGTRLDKNAFENLFFGGQYDFARGGSITTGVHLGRRTYIPGYSNFEFGKDVYSEAELVTKKEWAVGMFLGVSLDLRVIQYFLTGGQNPK